MPLPTPFPTILGFLGGAGGHPKYCLESIGDANAECTGLPFHHFLCGLGGFLPPGHRGIREGVGGLKTGCAGRVGRAGREGDVNGGEETEGPPSGVVPCEGRGVGCGASVGTVGTDGDIVGPAGPEDGSNVV